MAGLLGFLGSLSPNEDGTPNALQRFDNALNPGQQLQQLQTQAAMLKLQQEQATQTALANWAKKGETDPKTLYRDLAVADPSYLLKFIEASTKENVPLTDVGKLKADLDAGRIDQNTYDRRLAKEVAPTEKNYKHFQLQNAAFADMMVKADETLSPYEEKFAKGEFDPVSTTSSFLAGIPSLGLGAAAGNALLSEDQQKYKQAQEAWVRAKLRKESGAAIGVKEMEDEIKTFFPRIGDKPEVIKQKAMMRNEATKSMQKQTGGAYDDMYGGGEPQPAPTTPNKPKYQEGQQAKWPDGSIKTFTGGRWQ